MTVVALPDMLGALIAKLRTFTELTTLCGTSPPRISAALQDAWALPTYAILLRQVGGTADSDVQHQLSRVQANCYGSTPLTAMTLWRTLHPALCPGHGTARGFKQGSVRVLDVYQESGPFSLIEPDTNWPVVVSNYRLRWCEVPVA